MKTDKFLQKIIDNMVKDSFDEGGYLLTGNINKYTKLISSLPSYQAVEGLENYLKGLKRRLEAYTLNIQSVIPLSEKAVGQIVKFVKKENRVSTVNRSTDPSLIGGLKIKIGDMVYDNSINAQIKLLKDRMMS